MLQQLI